jgi:MraZ protein
MLDERPKKCGKVEESVENWGTPGTVFAGSFEYRMDRQGRLAIPPPFRRKLAERPASTLILTPADDALSAYPLSEWRELEKHILGLPAFSKKARSLSRVFASRAHECEIDAQGRILVPPPLRAAAALGRDVVVTGAMNRFEIWSAERWATFASEAERILEEASGINSPNP